MHGHKSGINGWKWGYVAVIQFLWITESPFYLLFPRTISVNLTKWLVSFFDFVNYN